MRAKLRSQWKNTSKRLKIAQIIGLMAMIALIVSFIGGYFFNWTWTGFGSYIPPTSNIQREKTLYDWLQLAIVPVALTFGIWWLTRLQQQRDQQLADKRAKSEREAADMRTQADREISFDNQREAALKEYIYKISELLLHENLSNSKPESEIRKIARVLTLTVLPRLDGVRKRSVLQFLYESGLVEKDKCIVDMTEADLSHAYLSTINLSKAEISKTNLDGVDFAGANLSGANLTGSYLLSANLNIANLSEANLTEANFTGADLSGANFTGANLHKTVLRNANLSGAFFIGTRVTDEQLKTAKGYQNVIMPNWPIHP
jgi:uncharacterized protein YjbI with pentapeptide repeats